MAAPRPAAGLRSLLALSAMLVAGAAALFSAGVAEPAASISPARAYSGYVTANTAQLVKSTQALCTAIDTGDLASAQRLYPIARASYEHIEPVAGSFGALDTRIDGRWENPVTVRSRFVGFHRIEQLLFATKTLKGAPGLCTALVSDEKRLQQLVARSTYTPLEIAAGATDLMNEAATSKISGEEERYSHTELAVIEANLLGAREIVSIFRPALATSNAGLLAKLTASYKTAAAAIASFAARPGYDGTGFVEYTHVGNSGRRMLSQAINAYAETLSQLSAAVG